MNDNINPDFDFRHHLHDTLVLLGCEPSISKLLKKSLDGAIASTDVDDLRNYNIGLMTATKKRLTSLNTLTIKPTQD